MQIGEALANSLYENPDWRSFSPVDGLRIRRNAAQQSLGVALPLPSHLAKPIGSYSPKSVERTPLGREGRMDAGRGSSACHLSVSTVPQTARK